MQAVAIGISFVRRFPRPLHTTEEIYLSQPHVKALSQFLPEKAVAQYLPTRLSSQCYKPQKSRVVLLVPQPHRCIFYKFQVPPPPLSEYMHLLVNIYAPYIFWTNFLQFGPFLTEKCNKKHQF